ncbi:hypothetical protein GQ53DRAFT_91651 [Thozetella sp. PMI_491]|nr:hypothetical protein GQ53DRAFT_91651 [Thozetella sp. PMI_491]
MGCCISRPSGPNSPYPGGVSGSASARAINGESSQPVGTTSTASAQGTDGLPSPSSGTGQGRRPPRSHHHPQSLAQHINKPLRRHEWTSRSRTWTPAALQRERAEFFDTRVAGRQEIWQTLRAALELLWEADAAKRRRAEEGDIDEVEGGEGEGEGEGDGDGPSSDDAAVALATAQSILSAADITLPTGDLAQGAYDAFGNYYPIPEHVVADPLNIARRDGGHLADTKGDLTAGEETAEEGDLDGEDEAERRREEKGKAVVDVRDQIAVRARLSEGSQDVSVSVGKGDSVRSLARRVAEEAGLPPNKKIRIAYMGKILKEGSPLPVQGWKSGHVVNALVFNR